MMIPTRRAAPSALLATLALLAGSGGALEAQDVELLGRIHGTRPPDAYYEERARDPNAFEFSRAWKGRTGLGPIELPAGPNIDAGVDGRAGAAARTEGLGRRDGPVEGTFAFPVVLGLFADSDFGAENQGPHSRSEVQREYFDGPNSRFKTISEYWAEVSGGRVELLGETFDWRRSELSRSVVAGGVSGLGGASRVGDFVIDLLEHLDGAGVDWARYDNDGPDGVPNSGDDDGYVDVLAVVHPTAGAECDRDPSRIWSHRWSLSSAAGREFTTSTSSANGEPVRIDDYVVVPVKACGGSALNQIGVFTHELGHGFGLPDLYGTGSSQHFGAGNWDLMATGSWGCDGTDAARPCHPGAWTKAVLGWVEIDTISAGAPAASIDLAPVEGGGRVLLVESNDGSDEYFLLEHRARDGSFDENLLREGMLVWHVDPSVVDARWGSNRVNADPSRPGVWLRQGDGADDLTRPGGGRGDAGDPFPGSSNRREYHAGTEPSSFTHAGGASGLTVTGIALSGGSVGFDLSNFYHTVTLRAEGADDASSYFSVDGASAPAAVVHDFGSAPFERHVIEAAGGALVSPGIREAFSRWEDGSTSRARNFRTRSDTLLVASYEGAREVHFDVQMIADSDTVTPGVLTFAPGADDGWVPEGRDVRVEVEARNGFTFQGWGKAFEGRSNPFFIEAAGPLEAEARFDVTYTATPVSSPIETLAATSLALRLETVNGTDPVLWSVAEGRLPAGMAVELDGRIHGAPLEEGIFDVAIRARDAIGLEAVVELQLRVEPPAAGLSTLTGPLLQDEGELPDLLGAYMDRSGNRNGRYDVGDFRAFLRAHPDTPEEAPATTPAPTTVELPPVMLEAPEEGER